LINPEPGASVSSTVRKLMGMSGVDEVYVTEGPHAFIVKAGQSSATTSKRTTTSIVRKFGRQVNVMTSYARYRK